MRAKQHPYWIRKAVRNRFSRGRFGVLVGAFRRACVFSTGGRLCAEVLLGRSVASVRCIPPRVRAVTSWSDTDHFTDSQDEFYGNRSGEGKGS